MDGKCVMGFLYGDFSFEFNIKIYRMLIHRDCRILLSWKKLGAALYVDESDQFQCFSALTQFESTWNRLITDTEMCLLSLLQVAWQRLQKSLWVAIGHLEAIESHRSDFP